MTTNRMVQRFAAAVVAAGYAVMAVVILRAGVGQGEYETASEYVVGYLFAGLLLALALAIGVFRDRSRVGASLVAGGSLVLLFGVMWGNVAGHDPSWFVVFGLPGNLAILVGSVVIARHVWREGTRGRVLAVLLVAYVPAGLIGAEAGGGLLAAVPWALVAVGLVGPRTASLAGESSPDGAAAVAQSA